MKNRIHEFKDKNGPKYHTLIPLNYSAGNGYDDYWENEDLDNNEMAKHLRLMIQASGWHSLLKARLAGKRAWNGINYHISKLNLTETDNYSMSDLERVLTS